MAKCIICGKKATYGYEKNNFKSAQYCATHGKENGAVDVQHKLCIEEGCTKRPWDGKDKMKCKIHSDMAVVIAVMDSIIISINGSMHTYKYCQHNDCVGKKKGATYGYNKNQPMYCSFHYNEHPHKDRMFDVNHPLCIICYEKNIYKRASYGDEKKTPLYCEEHSGDYTNTVSKKCQICMEVTPSYGYKTMTHCKKCAVEGMRCLSGVKCQECNKQASYGYPEQKKMILCGPHARAHPDWEKLQELRGRKCKHSDCNRFASFGYKGTKKRILCVKHKDEHPDKDQMESMNKMCIDCGVKQPTFGITSKVATHCADCKDPDMKDARHGSCQIENCETRPTYGNDKKATHCEKHGKPLGLQTINPICTNCNDTHANRHYGSLCATCFYELNPEAERTIQFKTKEFAYLNPLKELYPNLIQDRVIKGGISRRRPDGLLELDTHVIVVEIDEGQHTCYDDIHEDGRLREIYNDLNGRKMKVIRLNPDGCTINGKKREGSYQNCKGVLKQRPKEFNYRLDALKQEVDNSIKTIPTEEIEIVKLFYTIKQNKS